MYQLSDREAAGWLLSRCRWPRWIEVVL